MSNLPAAAEQIRSIITRVEKLRVDREIIAGDISDVFKEAKSNGLDVPALKHALKIRKMGKAEWDALDDQVQVYLAAAGD